MSRKRSIEELFREEERREKEAVIDEIARAISDDPKALARILYDLGCRELW